MRAEELDAGGGYRDQRAASGRPVAGRADGVSVAKRILFAGSIQWLENAVLDAHDLAAL